MKNQNKLVFALGTLILGGNALANETAEFESTLPQGSYNAKYEASPKSLVELSHTAGATSIRYISFAASAMKTLGTGTYEKDYAGAGCVEDSLDAASGMALDDFLDIPQGSRIVSASFLGYDTTSTDSYLGSLYEFTNGTASTVLSGFSGTAFDGGYVSAGGYLSNYVTQSGSLYGVRLEASPSNGAIELCGVRIGYIPENLVDDVIFASNFFR